VTSLITTASSRRRYFYYSNLRAGVVLVETPTDVLLLHTPVILVDAPLHTIKYQRLIKVRATTGIIDCHVNSHVLLVFFVVWNNRVKHRALSSKKLFVFYGLWRFNEGRALAKIDQPSAVGFAVGLSLDFKLDLGH